MTEPVTTTFTTPPPHSNVASAPFFGSLPASPGANSLMPGVVDETLPSTPSSRTVSISPTVTTFEHFRPLVSQPVNFVTFSGCETSGLKCSNVDTVGEIDTVPLEGVLGNVSSTTPGIRLF